MVLRIALMFSCFSLAVAAQTTPKTTPPTAPKTSPKAAPKASPAPAQKSGAAAAAKNPEAIIHTTAGDLKCELLPDKAPKAVANFIGLATGKKDWTNPATGNLEHNKPLYDGVIFHRVIPGFMIQGGDPMGTGTGGPGYKFEDELHADLLFDQPGRLAMANSGPNTNGSQFFITEEKVEFLNPCLDPAGCMGGRRPPNSGYTLFGQCDEKTVELARKIAQGPCQGGQVCSNYNSRAENPVKITHIEIIDASSTKTAKPAGSPAAKKPASSATPKKSTPTPKQ